MPVAVKSASRERRTGVLSPRRIRCAGRSGSGSARDGLRQGQTQIEKARQQRIAALAINDEAARFRQLGDDARRSVAAIQRLKVARSERVSAIGWREPVVGAVVGRWRYVPLAAFVGPLSPTRSGRDLDVRSRAPPQRYGSTMTSPCRRTDAPLASRSPRGRVSRRIAQAVRAAPGATKTPSIPTMNAAKRQRKRRGDSPRHGVSSAAIVAIMRSRRRAMPGARSNIWWKDVTGASERSRLAVQPRPP